MKYKINEHEFEFTDDDILVDNGPRTFMHGNTTPSFLLRQIFRALLESKTTGTPIKYVYNEANDGNAEYRERVVDGFEFDNGITIPFNSPKTIHTLENNKSELGNILREHLFGDNSTTVIFKRRQDVYLTECFPFEFADEIQIEPIVSDDIKYQTVVKNLKEIFGLENGAFGKKYKSTEVLKAYIYDSAFDTLEGIAEFRQLVEIQPESKTCNDSNDSNETMKRIEKIAESATQKADARKLSEIDPMSIVSAVLSDDQSRFAMLSDMAKSINRQLNIEPDEYIWNLS